MRISDWSSDVCSSDLRFCGIWFAWASIETPAWTRICFEVNLVISEAISRSNRLDRADSWFSIEVARLADANSSRFCEAPTFARAVFSVSMALEIASEEIGRASCRERVCQYV